MTDEVIPDMRGPHEEERVSDRQLRRLAFLCDHAKSPAPWRSMREGNQYFSPLFHDGYYSGGRLVGASRIDGVKRPWSPYYVVPAEQLEEVVRFTDEDADLVAAARNLLPALVRELQERRERDVVTRTP